MHFPSLRSLRRAARRLQPAPAAVVLLSVSGFTARANVAAPAATAPVAPPPYAIQEHVFNGCHLSAIAFVARFHADFPAEHAEALVISMRNAGRARKAHTVALVSWRGSWWCRDEYFGVMPLGRKVEAHPDRARLTERLETVLERRAREFMNTAGGPRPAEAPTELIPVERLQQAVIARRIIPFPSRIFWVGPGRDAAPVVFFRPSAAEIGLYDPLHGTCVATCSLPDDAKVVSLAAARLGYDAREVRADSGIVGGMLVAVSDNRPTALSP